MGVYRTEIADENATERQVQLAKSLLEPHGLVLQLTGFTEIMKGKNLARALTGLSLLLVQNELFCKTKAQLVRKGLTLFSSPIMDVGP